MRQTTTQTVTTYVKRRTKQLPLQELKPADQAYQRLVHDEQAVIEAAERAARQEIVTNQQQRQAQAQQSAVKAEQTLRQSHAYQCYLQQLAAIIVMRPERPMAKQQFEKSRHQRPNALW